MAHYRRQGPQDFTVWADNWPAIETFAACSTQWRYLPMGGAQGIDYSSLRAVIQMRGVMDQSDLFDSVRLIERGALWAMAGKPLDELING